MIILWHRLKSPIGTFKDCIGETVENKGEQVHFSVSVQSLHNAESHWESTGPVKGCQCPMGLSVSKRRGDGGGETQ